MGLETGTFVSDLVDTNPINTDKKRQGDDHIRLIKEILQNTFPNADKAFYFPTSEAKTSSFSVVVADMQKTFFVSTSGGEVTATLPALASGDAGWQCHFVKTNTGLNALFIAPNSGTLTSGEVSGLAQCRRVIPGHRCTAHWDGSAWFVTRNCSAPVAGLMDFHGATLPVGYELPYGQTLASASTKYPEFYAVNGNSGVVVDLRGRVVAGFDAMGGVSASRLTTGESGVDGGTLKAAGGAQSVVLEVTDLPSHTHTGTTGDGGAHTHTVPVSEQLHIAGGPTMSTRGGGSTSTSSDGTHTHAFTTDATGSGATHNNTQPTMVLNKIVVVE